MYRNRESENIERLRQRILAGARPRLATLEKHGLTVENYNELCRQSGQTPQELDPHLIEAATRKRKNERRREEARKKPKVEPIAPDVPKTCSRCKEEKTAGDFHVTLARNDGRSCYCKVCTRDIQIEKISGSPESFIEMRYHKAKQDAREKSLEFDLTITFLIWLFYKQGRICPVTLTLKNKMPSVFGHLDEQLTWRFGEAGRGRRGYCLYPQNISIDRIDPEKGYTRDNVQLVTTKMNRELCGTGSCLRALLASFA